MAEIVQLALEIEARRLRKDLNNLEKEIQDVGKAGDKSAKRVNGSFKRIQKEAKDTAASIRRVAAAFAGGAAGIGIGKAAFDIARQVEFNFAKIRGLVGASAEEIEFLNRRLGDIAAATGVGPVELSDALFNIKSQGVDAATAVDVLTKAALASANGLGETNIIAKALLGSIASYGQANLDASRALDVLIKGFQVGDLNAGALAGSLGQVTGTAAELGVEFEDLIGFVANISLTGLSAERSVTKLGAVLRTLSKPVPQIEAVGVKFAELQEVLASGPGGLERALRLIRDRAEAAGKSLAEVIPDSEALSGALSVVGENSEKAAENFEKVRDSAGAASEANAAFAGTADRAARIARANLDSALNDLGTATLPIVTANMEFLAKAIRTVTVLWFNQQAAFKDQSALEQTLDSLGETSDELFDLREQLRKREAGNIDFFDLDNSKLKAKIAETEEIFRKLEASRDRLLQKAINPKVDNEEANKDLDETKGKADELEKTDPKVTVTAETDEAQAALDALRDRAQARIDQLKRENALFGERTNLEKITYEIESGELQGIVKEQKTLLEEQAKDLDLKEKRAKAAQEAARIEQEAINTLKNANAQAEAQKLRDIDTANQIIFNQMSERDQAIAMAGERIEEVQRLGDLGLLSEDQVDIEVKAISDDLNQLLDKGQETFNAMEEFSAQTFKAMESAASDLFFGVMQGNLDGFADNFKRTIDRIAADVLSSQLFDQQSGVFASLLNTGGQTGGTTGTSGGFFAGLATLFAADGAFAKRNQPFIVGEKGPELFVPQTAGNIIPLKGPGELPTSGPSNDQISTGTQQVTVNMTINTPDVASFQRSQGQLAANAAATFNTALKRNG